MKISTILNPLALFLGALSIFRFARGYPLDGVVILVATAVLVAITMVVSFAG